MRASAREDKTLGQVALSAALALTLTVGTPSEPAFARATSPAAQRAGVESAAAVTPDSVKKESAFNRVQVSSRQAQAGLYESDDSLSGALASRYGAVAPTRPESNPFKGTEIQKKKEQAAAPAPKAFGAKPAAAPKPAAAKPAAKPAAASSDKVSRFDPTIVIGAAAVVGLAAYSATNKPSGAAKSTTAAKPVAKAATAKKTPEQNAAEAQEWIDNWKPSGKAKDNTAEAQEWIDNWKKSQK